MNRLKKYPGVYKDYQSGLVTKWDIVLRGYDDERFSSPEILHTIEFTLLEYLREKYGSYRILGVFMNGDLKGLSVLTKFIDSINIYETIIDYTMELQTIMRIDSDNDLHDLRGAKNVMYKFYDDYLKFYHKAENYN